jgi:putative redox protein
MFKTMSQDSPRTVRLDRVSDLRFTATNAQGATITVGNSGADAFSPVELLLAAIAGCTAMDVDYATNRRAQPTEFSVTVSGNKVSDEEGNRMTDLRVSFHVDFPEGTDGDAARTILPRAAKLSHDKLCTVSRTVERGTPVTSVVEP